MNKKTKELGPGLYRKGKKKLFKFSTIPSIPEVKS
jgi:hypothetical protein